MPTISPRVYAEVIERAEKLDLGELASLIVVQSMKRALYSVENKGHFGLASDCYTHFTSPIAPLPGPGDPPAHQVRDREEREGMQRPVELLSEGELAAIAAIAAAGADDRIGRTRERRRVKRGLCSRTWRTVHGPDHRG